MSPGIYLSAAVQILTVAPSAPGDDFNLLIGTFSASLVLLWESDQQTFAVLDFLSFDTYKVLQCSKLDLVCGYCLINRSNLFCFYFLHLLSLFICAALLFCIQLSNISEEEHLFILISTASSKIPRAGSQSLSQQEQKTLIIHIKNLDSSQLSLDVQMIHIYTI